MRLKYYLLTLRQMNIKKSFVLISIILLFIILICILICNKSLKPTVSKLCDEKALMLARKASNNAVIEATNGITYDDLVTIKQDSDGKINAIIANTATMNKISTNVTTEIENELDTLTKNVSIKVPFESFIGLNFFAGHGIRFSIKVIPIEDIKTEFKSTFESAGINQTKHRIYIDVITSIQTIAPFVSETKEFVNTIMIAETVIVGNIPQTYYNIEGIENWDKKDSLEIME